MNKNKETGAEELRTAVAILNNCRESFLDPYSAEQLIQIVRMMRASAWDFRPDEWAPEQVVDALAGIAPQWNHDETPKYSPVYWIATATGRAKRGPYVSAEEAGKVWPMGAGFVLAADYRDGGGIQTASERDVDTALSAMLRTRKGA